MQTIPANLSALLMLILPSHMPTRIAPLPAQVSYAARCGSALRERAWARSKKAKLEYYYEYSCSWLMILFINKRM